MKLLSPVPPDEVGSGEASVIAFSALTTFVPSQYSTIRAPAATAMPVPPEVLNVSAKPPVVLLKTKYSLETAGTMTLRAAPGVPVAVMNILRASLAAPSVLVSV